MLSLPPPPAARSGWLALCLVTLASVAGAQPVPAGVSPTRAAADRAFDAGRFAEARRGFQADCDARRDGHSCQRIANLLSKGQGGPEDAAGALRYARLACEAGNGRGCGQVGMMLRSGHGTPADPVAAVPFLDRACDLGWGYSCFVRASAYWDDPATRDDARSRPYFDRACRLGTNEACYFIGYLAYWGHGGPVDYARAREAYTQSCDRDTIDPWQSCSTLASMAQEGKGGPVDLPQARRRYGVACEHGVLFACNNLAVLERLGRGGPVDHVAAYRRLDRACAAGDAVNCETARVFRELDEASRLAAKADAEARARAERAASADDSWRWQSGTSGRRYTGGGSAQGAVTSGRSGSTGYRPPPPKPCRWKTYEGYGGGRVCVQE